MKSYHFEVVVKPPFMEMPSTLQFFTGKLRKIICLLVAFSAFAGISRAESKFSASIIYKLENRHINPVLVYKRPDISSFREDISGDPAAVSHKIDRTLNKLDLPSEPVISDAVNLSKGLIKTGHVHSSFISSPTISSFTPAGGAIGTLVTISGSNLSGLSAFNIGNKAAIVISNSGTKLVGMVMPGATTGAVSVSTGGGSASGSGNFTVTATLAPSTQQGAKLTGSGQSSSAQFGHAVAISGDGNTAVTGAYADSPLGATFIYVRVNGVWVQQGSKLVGSTANPTSNQGYSVAISADGNTMITSAVSEGSSGTCWVFVRNGTTWSQQAKIAASDATNGALFGMGVSMSGDGNTVLVGGIHDSIGGQLNIGASWIFSRSGTTWSQVGSRMVGSGYSGIQIQQGWGEALSADGLTAMVGGSGGDAFWIFVNNGGTWSQQGSMLTSTGITGPYAEIGWSAALSADGNVALVGGNLDGVNNSNLHTGAAWIWTRSGTAWTQYGSKLVGSGAIGTNSQQGTRVSLSADGNIAFISGIGDNTDAGATWVYKNSGSGWVQQTILKGTGGSSAAQQGTGMSISSDGSAAFIGGAGDTGGATNTGAGWTFMPNAPYIYTSGSLSGLSSTYGVVSGTGNFTVSGVYLTQGITVGPLTGYEFSLSSGSGFGSSLSVGSSGTISPTTVYVRIAAGSNAGSLAAGGIPMTSSGAATVNMNQPASTVNQATLTVTAKPLSQTYGTMLNNFAGNSTFYTVTGLQNSDAISTVPINYVSVNGTSPSVATYTNQLSTGTPTFTTGSAANYAITPVPGTLTVTAATLTVTARDTTKAYGSTLTSGTGGPSTFTSAGLKNGDVIGNVPITYGPASAANTAVNTYPGQVIPGTNPSFSTGNPANYTISTVSGSIIVTATPTISTSGSLPDLSTTYGTATNPARNFNVSGIYMTAGITVNAPTAYEVSLSSTTGYASSITVGTSGTIASTPIYVRIAAATNTGSYAASNVALTSSGATQANLATMVSTVSQAPLVLKANDTTKAYGTTLTSGNGSNSFTTTSLKNADAISNVIMTYGSASAASTVAGTYTGQVTPTSPAFTTGSLSNYSLQAPVKGTITVTPVPTISTTGSLSALSTTYGTATNPAGTFNVSGANLTAGITVTAPSSYEVSLSSSTGYSVSVVVGSTGTLTSTPVYIRIAATTAVGSVAASSAALTSSGAAPVNVATVASTVGKASLSLTANDVTKPFGTTLTSGASYGGITPIGLMNGDLVGTVYITYATGVGAGAPAGASAGTYPGQVTAGLANFSSGNASNYTITYPAGSIIVNAAPSISMTGSLSDLSTTYGTAIATPGTFNVSGIYMTQGILATAPAGYELSLSSATGFAASITVGSSGTIPSTPVYVRLAAATSVGSGYGGNIVLSSTSATSVNVATVTSAVTPASLVLAATNTTKAYGATLTSGISSTGYTIAGLKNTDGVSSLTLTYTTGTGAGAPAGAPSGTYTGQIIPSLANFSTGLASNYTITYPVGDIIVSSTPTISTSGSLSALTTTYGKATASPGTFNVSGIYLTQGILVTAPTGYEVSLSIGSGYAQTTTVSFVSGGTIPSTPVYIRLAASTAVGSAYAGNVLLSSAGVASTIATTTSAVTVAPLVITANQVTKNYGVQLTGAPNGTAFSSVGLMNSESIGTVTTSYAAGSATTATPGTNTGTASVNTPVGGTFTLSNYSVSLVSGNIIVNAAPLTVTATGPAKPFGTALATGASTTNFTVSGSLAPGENLTSVTLTPDANGLAANTPKGATYSVVPSSATGTGGFIAGNYAITFVPFPGTVGAGSSANVLTITATGPGRVFGTALAAGTSTTDFTVSGLVNGDQVTGITLTPDANGLSATAASGSSYSITPSTPTGNASFLASNYTINFVPYPGTISSRALSIIATGPSRAYHTALTTGSSTTNFTATGLAPGDLVNSVTLTPDAAGLSASTAAGAAYVVTPSVPAGNTSFNASNYTITFIPFSGAVSASVLTVTATGPAKTYGAVLAATTGTSGFTATGMVGGETVTSITLTPDAAGASATTAVNGGYTVTPSSATGNGGFLASNYTVNYVPFSGTVTQALLTLTASGPLKKYGISLVAGTSTSSFTSMGLKPGETITSVTLTPDAPGLSATTATGAGYSVAVSAPSGANGFLASNYTITYASYNGTVGSTNLTVTATNPNKIFGTALATGASGTGFTVSGTQTGETVTSITLTPDAAGLSATTAAGTTYSVVPTAATGTGGFLASNYVVTYIPYTGTVKAASLSILASAPLKSYGTALTPSAVTTGFTASGATGGDQVTGVTLTPDASGQSASAAVGSAYQVVPSLPTGNGSFTTSNYAITYLPFTGTVSAIPLTVTARGPSKAYGTALSSGATSANFTASGMAAGETVTGITLTPDAAGLSAGTPGGASYSVIPTGATGSGGFLASNYAVNYIPYSGTVGTLALTITATGTTKTYGQALAAGTVTTNFTATGAVGGDVVTGITLTPDAAGISSTTAAGAHFVMTPSAPTGNSSFIAANYTITYVGFPGTVLVAPLTVNATGPLKKYGVALTTGSSTSSFTAVGALAGEAVSSVTLTPDAAGLSASTPNGSPYTVTASAAVGTGGFLASNYQITYNYFSGLVGTAALTITATGPVKTYGTAIATGPTGLNFTASGTFPGETVTSVTLTPDAPGASASTGVGSSFTVTPSLPTGTGGFLASNYTITFMPYSKVVTQAPLVLTATGPSKSYGTALSAGTSTASFTGLGMVNGDVINSVTLTPDAAGASATTASGAGYAITPSAPSGTGSFNANNYLITYTPYNGTVSSGNVTITANGPSKMFGVALNAGTTTNTSLFTATGMAAGQTVTGITLTPDAVGLSASSPYNSGYQVTPSSATGTGGFLASNYTMVYRPYNGLVAQAPLLVIATGPTRSYGTTLSAATSTINFTATGMLNGDKITGVTLTPDIQGQSANLAAGSTYTVASSLATGNSSFLANNYAISYVPFTATVATSALLVTATGPQKSFGMAIPIATSTTNFTATGALAQGEQVTGVTLNPDGQGQSSSTLKGTAYVVTPSLATGTGGFNARNYAINYQPYTGITGGALLTITATGPGRIYGTPLSAGTSQSNFTVTGLLNGDQVTGITLTPDANGSAANAASGASYVVTPSAPTGNASFIASNYTVVFVPYSGTISSLALNITATGPAKTYHTALTAGSSTSNFTAKGLASSDLISSVTLTPDAAGLSASTNAGAAYIVTPSSPVGNSSFQLSNYTITFTPFNGAVLSNPLTITATGPAKPYGTALYTAVSTSGFTARGTVSGEAVTGITLTPDAAGASATAAKGTSYTIRPSSATGSGGFLASNYAITYLPYTGTVSSRTLVIAAVGPLKKAGVGLTTGSSTSSFTATGLASGESISSVTLTPDAAGLSAATPNGSPYTVNATAPVGSAGFNLSNYAVSFVPYTGTVGNINLTITATSPDKTYGTSISPGSSTAGFTVSGTQQGETVTSVTLTPDAAGLSASSAAGTPYSMKVSLATGTGGFLASNYTVTYVPFTGQVGAAPLSILASGPAKNYGTSLAAISTSNTAYFTASGAMLNDQVTGVTLTPDPSGQSASTAAGSTYQVVPSLPTGNGTFLASNYDITYLPYTGIVNAIPLTVTATGPNKAYSTPLSVQTSSSNFTASGMAPGEVVTNVTLTPDAPGLSATTPAGSAYSIIPSVATGTGGFLASNYMVSYVPYAGTVNSLSMTITATGPSKPYGTPLASGMSTTNFTATGAIGGDIVTGVLLTPDQAGASASTSSGTIYSVTPSAPIGNAGFVASNYTITFKGYTGTVGKTPLTITTTGPLKRLGTALTAGTSTGSFTAVGLLPGEKITSVTLTPDAAGLSASTANGNPYTVKASAPQGIGGFNAANYSITYADYNGIVGVSALTITATDPARTYGMPLSTVTSSSTGFTTSGTFPGETVTNVMLTPDAAGSSPDTHTGAAYSMTPTLATGTGGFDPSHYIITYVPFSGVVSQASLSITATGPSKSYGLSLPAASSTSNFTSVGLVNGDLITSVFLTPDNAGSATTTASGAGYVVTPSAPAGNSTFNAGNYNITFTPYYGKVAEMGLTITATDPGKIYGTALQAGVSGTGFTYSGLQPGQLITGVTLTPDAGGASASTPAGTAYNVQPSAPVGTNGFLASNYTINYVPFAGTVARKTLTVLATGVNKIYANTPVANVTFTDNRLAGDMLLIKSQPAYFFDKNVGLGKVVTVNGISISGPSAGNYSVNTSALTTASISPAPVIVAAVMDSRIYDNTTASAGSPLITGLIGTDAYNTVTSQTFDNSNAGTGKTLTPAVTINDGNSGNNYTVLYRPAITGTISQATVRVTAYPSTKVYDNSTISSAVPVVTGLMGTDASSIPPTETYDTPAIGSGKTMTPAGLTINDGNGGNNYTVIYVVNNTGIITPAGSNSAFLSSLIPSVGTVSPAFATGTYAYTMLVGNNTSSITLTPTVLGTSSEVTVNGIPLTSGTASESISLSYGSNTILTKVFATNGTTSNTYTLVVTRGESSMATLVNMFPDHGILVPKFATDTLDYKTSVDNSVSSIIIAAVLSDATATVTVNGLPVTNGVAPSIVLNPGENTITTIVTAQDGITQTTYTNLITRGVAPLVVIASNILTPNGDGVNDKWVINGILNFPNNIVTVYDRTGRIVFTKKGYTNDWTATYRGVVLNEDTYYYVIDPGNGSKATRGFITILRDKK